MTEKQIKIISHTRDFSTKINLNGETYVIDSEDLGIQNPHIVIRDGSLSLPLFDVTSVEIATNKPEV